MTDRLSKADLLYEPLIAQYLGPGFVERAWLAGRVEQHFRDPDCRFVLLVGGPGSGKSAFVAWLARRHPLSPRYFLRRLSSHPLASGDASSLLLSVGHQLAVFRPEVMRTDLDVRVRQSVGRVAAGGRVVGVRVGVLQMSPFQRTAVQVDQDSGVVAGVVAGIEVERMVTDPRLHDLGNLQNLALLEPALRLAAQDPEALVVVLIDALDELRYSHGDIADWLADCPELPPNVRILVSCRPDRQLLQRFRLAQADRLREETIEPSADEVTADLVVYVESVLADPALAGIPPVSAARVVERAQGSFLYLVLWARGLRDATRVASLTDLSTLPHGLAGIYTYFLAQVRDTVRRDEGPSWMRVWKRVHRRLLGVLAVARASVTAERLLVLAGLEDQREDALDALTLLDQFLIEDAHGIRLCHSTLAEFLVEADREDWHVDAALNHERIADGLIAEHGGSWSSCEDEYALSHTVTHLLAAGPRCADRLTALLADPSFGIAKCLKLGAGPMVRDHLDAHTTLPQRPEIAEGLAETLARLADCGVPDLAGTLHAVVGYRPDAAEFYRHVLSLLADRAHLEPALIEFSQAEAARLRRTGNADDVAEARQVLRRAVSGRDVDTLSSALCYELGYLDFLCGEPAKALAWLEKSVERADDHVGRHISRLVAMKVGLRSGAVTASTYRTAHEDALAFLRSAEAEGPHVERWIMTAASHLLDLGLWTDDKDLITSSLRALEEDPWIRKHRRDDLLTMARARAAAGTGDWATACSSFATGLADVPSHREELARDLYYYGLSLARTGDTVKAREIWEQGLNSPDNAANWPWLPKIADALARPLPDTATPATGTENC